MSRCGIWGVDLFFVLSGFLITGILLDSKGSSGYFSSFYARRFLRLFPVYYGYLLVVAIIVPAFHHIVYSGAPDYHGNWWWYVLYFGNWKPDWISDPYLYQFWSLAVEEQFYCLWPVTVLLLSRRALAWSCGGLWLTAVVLKFVLQGTAIDAYTCTFTRLDALSIGALLALALRDQRWSMRFRKTSGLVCAIAFPVFVAFSAHSYRHIWNPYSASVAPFFFGGLVFQCATARDGVLPHLMSAPWLRSYGKYSYCIYKAANVLR